MCIAAAAAAHRACVPRLLRGDAEQPEKGDEEHAQEDRFRDWQPVAPETCKDEPCFLREIAVPDHEVLAEREVAPERREREGELPDVVVVEVGDDVVDLAAQLRDLDQGPAACDVFFSSKGHDAPALYNVLIGLGLLPPDKRPDAGRSLHDLDTTNYGQIATRFGTSRLPPFHQLDLRIDRKWVFEAFSMTTYLDLLNVYNQQNAEGYQDDFRYREREPIPSLPILPVIGASGEF